MSRFIPFLTPILLLPLMSCGSAQHDVQEKYFFVTANTKVAYWQEAAAGFNRAAAHEHHGRFRIRLHNFFKQLILTARQFEVSAIRTFRVISAVVTQAADVNHRVGGFGDGDRFGDQIGVHSRR